MCMYVCMCIYLLCLSVNRGVSVWYKCISMYIYIYINLSIYSSIFLINIIYFINPGNSHSFYLLFSFFSIIISFKTTCCMPEVLCIFDDRFGMLIYHSSINSVSFDRRIEVVLVF